MVLRLGFAELLGNVEPVPECSRAGISIDGLVDPAPLQPLYPSDSTVPHTIISAMIAAWSKVLLACIWTLVTVQQLQLGSERPECSIAGISDDVFSDEAQLHVRQPSSDVLLPYTTVLLLVAGLNSFLV